MSFYSGRNERILSRLNTSERSSYKASLSLGIR